MKWKLLLLLLFFPITAYATNYTLPAPPEFCAYDNSGDPLAGGKVYVYAAGTTILGTTYVDGDGSSENTNPVILDTRGCADIWLHNATSYKFRVDTSADVTIYTIDDVRGIQLDPVMPTPSSSYARYHLSVSASGYWTLNPGLPDPGSGTVGQVVAVNAATDGYELVSNETVPDATTGTHGQAVVVDSAETGYELEFSLPVGTVLPFAAETVPSGFFECDGSEKSRATESDLYDVIGTLYGPGNGSTTFNLPDYRGQFLRGWNNSKLVPDDPDVATRTDSGDGTGDSATGDHVGTKQASAYKNHRHGDTGANSDQEQAQQVGGSAVNTADYGTPVTSTTGADESRPINVYVMYIIKY